MITHKQATELIGALRKMENLVDCYTVMRITGDMIDECGKNGTAGNYWDLNNLWWSAASIYVPVMRRLNNLSGNSH